MRKGDIARVEFDETAHRYFYDGHELLGITAAIARRLGKSFPRTAEVELACSYGSQVHKEIERWIKEGAEPDTDNGRWLKSALLETQEKSGCEGQTKFSAEVRVSDFETTASNVDVVLHTPAGVLLFDIKTGRFDREYCTLQLNAYRLMYENSYGEKVLGLFVLSTRARRIFSICGREDEAVLRILEENRK